MTATVQLHCTSSKTTVDNFVISPYQSNDQVLQSVRLALDIKHTTLYTVDPRYVADVQSLQGDQPVLVAAAPEERILPDATYSYVLYDGEETEDVDSDVDGLGQTWEDLTEREKCDHITSLDENATAEQMAAAETNIGQRWRVTYDHFFPESMRRVKFKISGKIWNSRVLAPLEVLSSFTPGHARVAAEVLEEAVTIWLDEGEDASQVVQCEDVANAVAVVYERAGVIPVKLTKPKTDKMRDKERRKALKGKKKAEKCGCGAS